MIFVTDKGRMCNNILQYGHLYAWGREHSVGTVSMRFCYKYPYFSIRHKRWHNPLTYALVKAAVKLKMMPVVEFHQMGSVYRDEQEHHPPHASHPFGIRKRRNQAGTAHPPRRLPHVVGRPLLLQRRTVCRRSEQLHRLAAGPQGAYLHLRQRSRARPRLLPPPVRGRERQLPRRQSRTGPVSAVRM